MEIAIARPDVPTSVLWDVASEAEMHARRLELAASAGIRYERRYYMPFDSSGRGLGPRTLR